MADLSRAEFAICVATFYDDIAERLVSGAIEGFSWGGVSAASVQTHEVPGAFELPLAVSLCAESGDYAGVVALGAVIRGETSHYDHVCDEATRGLGEVQLRTGVPVGYGLVTAENREQAEARAGGDKRNQGAAAATAVLRMVELREQLTS